MVIEGMMRFGSRRFLLLTVAAAIMVGDRAEAMDPDTAPLVESCAFPSTVRVAGHCTGSYLGNGVVLTAGHCMDFETIFSVTFGDADSGANRFTISVDEDFGCLEHPDGNSLIVGNDPHYEGVDLGVCILDEEDPDYEYLANLPVAPLMVPTGCVRDWLRHELYVIHGCAQPQKKVEPDALPHSPCPQTRPTQAWTRPP
jgi:hypothetical protein